MPSILYSTTTGSSLLSRSTCTGAGRAARLSRGLVHPATPAPHCAGREQGACKQACFCREPRAQHSAAAQPAQRLARTTVGDSDVALAKELR